MLLRSCKRKGGGVRGRGTHSSGIDTSLSKPSSNKSSRKSICSPKPVATTDMIGMLLSMASARSRSTVITTCSVASFSTPQSASERLSSDSWLLPSTSRCLQARQLEVRQAALDLDMMTTAD